MDLEDPLEDFMRNLTEQIAGHLGDKSLDAKHNPLEIYKSQSFE